MIRIGASPSSSVASVVAAIGTGAVGLILWRAWRNGAFRAGRGKAFQAWHRRTEGLRAVLDAAVLAASPHNTQPWRFRLTDDAIEIRADPRRNLGAFDPFRRELHIGLGCALENLLIATRAAGWHGSVEVRAGRLPPEPGADEPVAVVRLTPAQPHADGLFQAIAHRHTHRGAYRSDAIADSVLDEMCALASDENVRLQIFTGQRKRELGRLVIESTRNIVNDAAMAADSARWYRFRWHQVQRLRDGLTLDSNIVAPLTNLLAKAFPPSARRADRFWLRDTAKVHVATAPVLGAIVVRDVYDLPTALAAGRLWQRLHLWLTARGIAAQPLNQPVEWIDRERELGPRSHALDAFMRVSGEPDWQPTFIFRAGYGRHAARASPRRPLDEVLG